MKLANVPDTSSVVRSSEPPATSAASGREPPPPACVDRRLPLGASERESLLLAALTRDAAVQRQRERAQARLGPRGRHQPEGHGRQVHRVEGRVRAIKQGPKGLTTGPAPRQPQQEGIRR